MKAGVEEIAVFGAVSETFSKKNTNCTIVIFKICLKINFNKFI